ncbi:energy transducer TonB [Paractinoplanes maris]|uniref:energy transducer TonB n=1 Tax=Paractinoplanes maris TaxID=1734446 RepID=UPI0020215B4F|nr:energy transducer TonB [Actinoplanes maris]
MTDDRLEHLRVLAERGETLAAQARAAGQRASGATGADPAGAVTVTLDEQGRVGEVTVVPGWRRRLGSLALDEAVIEAVRVATRRRFEAWGDAWAGDAPATAPALDRDDFTRRLQAAAGGSGPLSAEDSRAALRELLTLAESIEQGLDQVSGALSGALAATHTGRSPDRKVRVTVTGGGDVTAIAYDRQWLLQAHEINVARQTTAAFRAAYAEADRHGVRELIAESRLSEAQQLAQDPLGLARRLRLTD